MSEIDTTITAENGTGERRSKRRAIVAGALALLAVGGIGAALTSAAWTDDVFYSAAAQGATFNLQGSLDGDTWAEGNPQGAAIVVPPATFANLVPGQPRTVTLHVRNDSSVAATLLANPTVTWSGSTFTTNPTATVSALPTSLAAAGVTTFELTVTTPSDWADTNKAKTGTIIVQVSGQASAS